jgi:hypothetical protein
MSLIAAFFTKSAVLMLAAGDGAPDVAEGWATASGEMKSRELRRRIPKAAIEVAEETTNPRMAEAPRTLPIKPVCLAFVPKPRAAC